MPMGGAAAGMQLDPTQLFLKQEANAEADLGEETKLDRFNCDLNLVIDETGFVQKLITNQDSIKTLFPLAAFYFYIFISVIL